MTEMTIERERERRKKELVSIFLCCTKSRTCFWLVFFLFSAALKAVETKVSRQCVGGLWFMCPW